MLQYKGWAVSEMCTPRYVPSALHLHFATRLASLTMLAFKCKCMLRWITHLCMGTVPESPRVCSRSFAFVTCGSMDNQMYVGGASAQEHHRSLTR